MRLFDENLLLGQEICSEIKSSTVCSNDIILRKLLPRLTLAMLPSAKQQFGTQAIEAYLRHTSYLKQVRDLLTDESRKRKMQAATSSAAIAVARLGVGECQELSIFALSKLIARGHRDVAFVAIRGRNNDAMIGVHPFLHAFILIGVDETFAIKIGEISQLRSLPDHVVIIDPLLGHVARASQYLDEQTEYLSQFGYNKICAIDIVSQLHIDNHTTISNNVTELLEFAETHGVESFDRGMCELPLANNPSSKKEACEETALLRVLNAGSGLTFSGVADTRCRVDAVTEILSEEQAITAKRIQTQLGTGCFYSGSSQRFFVLHDINVAVSSSENLPRRIHDTYHSLTG